jgi:hypothetical protein
MKLLIWKFKYDDVYFGISTPERPKMIDVANKELEKLWKATS